MVKAQPSLFVFNKNSHLEGIMHYNTALNSQWKLNDAELLDEEGLDESDEYLEIDDLDDEDEEDFDLDEEDDLDDVDEEDDL